MGNPKKSDSKNDGSKEISDDSIKLLIREEVERRFNSPTAPLIKFIEDEVRARIRRQEWYYWGILIVIAVLSSVIVSTFWKTELKQIPAEINKQLASAGFEESQKELTNYVANARVSDATLNRLLITTKVHADDVTTNLDNLLSTTKSTAENINSNLTQIPSTIDTNIVAPLSTRLEQIKNQDNILLVDDLQKLFVREIVTNLVDGNTMVLSFDPVPSTVRMYSFNVIQGGGVVRYFLLDNFGYCQGKTLFITNRTPVIESQVLSHVLNGGIEVEYVRRSLR